MTRLQNSTKIKLPENLLETRLKESLELRFARNDPDGTLYFYFIRHNGKYKLPIKLRDRKNVKFEDFKDIIWSKPPTITAWQNMIAESHSLVIKDTVHAWAEPILKDANSLSLGTFFDFFLDGERAKVSFVPKTKLKTMYPEHSYPMFSDKVANTRSLPVGRFMKALYPEMSDADIEAKVAQITSFIRTNTVTVEFVGADEIRWTYLRDNYHTHDTGGLLHSCMCGKDVQANFEFFEKNPNNFGIVRAMRHGKVVGRVLIYKTDSGDYFHESIYGGAAARIEIQQKLNEMKAKSAVHATKENGVISLEHMVTKADPPLPAMDSIYVDRKAKKIFMNYNNRSPEATSYARVNSDLFGRAR